MQPVSECTGAVRRVRSRAGRSSDPVELGDHDHLLYCCEARRLSVSVAELCPNIFFLLILNSDRHA